MEEDPKQRKITEFFKKKENIIKGYNEKTGSWHCIDCGVDMGPSNSRQLCFKTYCLLNFYNYIESPVYKKYEE
jgi:hypothetical protein